jgi:hypothetical protein
MPRPDLSRVPEYYHRYINQVPEDELTDAFTVQAESLFLFLDAIPADKRDHRYAADKWTIKEMLQHIVDTERVFAYRALCIARQDTVSLPGFDENSYAAHSKADQRNWDDLVEELKAVRKASEILFRSFDAAQLDSTGTANNKPVYVLPLGFILVGHVYHHLNVLRERYL